MSTAAFIALVIAVHDGDTVRVRSSAGITQSLRLAHIDAPELKQPGGHTSQRSLSDLCLQTMAGVKPITRDRYGRLVVGLSCDARDASRHQIEMGMAWVFTRYEPPDSPLYAAQATAQQGRIGIWAQDGPLPPWTWRKAQQSEKIVGP
jgi:micrococcal nuclease